jgi:predicted DNA-binding antitoxin AbrB/MazE fold protein
LEEKLTMSITIEATYEQGSLKLAQPLPLKEHERVRITIHTQSDWVSRTRGMMGWTGDAETVEHVAMDPDLDPQEEP